MSKRIRSLPSPALAIAVLALMVAVGGGTFALAKGGGLNKKIAKIANKSITGRAPKLSVNYANGAGNASHADSASHADNATHADNASHADKASNADNATNAALLGGTPASGFQSKIFTAVVTNDGTNAAVVRGTPETSAKTEAIGDVFVKFPVDVSACTWIATVGNPGATTAPPDFASVRATSSEGPAVVQVLTWDTSGAEVAANFHLAAIC